jgi:hypothetical protein
MTWSNMTRLLNCLGLLVVPALCLHMAPKMHAPRQSEMNSLEGETMPLWRVAKGRGLGGWLGRTSMGVAVPQTCNQLRPPAPSRLERACPRTPPDLDLHLSMCLHPCIPCTQSARLLPTLWKRNPSLPPSTLPYPPTKLSDREVRPPST